MKRIIATFFLITTMIITQTGCSSEITPVSVDNYYLDTTCNITVYGTGEIGTAKADADWELDEEVAHTAIDEAYKLCAKLDKTLSRTAEASDITKINSALGQWVEVSDYTIELLHKGVEFSELSDGAFDITIGGVTSMWDFHAENPEVPEGEALGEAADHVDWHKLEFGEGNTVRLTDLRTKIDLGGIAKGYIGDKMAEVLVENGVNSAIINLGGNIICIGSKPDGSAFTIGVETPYSDRTEISGTLEACDQTVVTSGVYERYFEVNGVKYHHILSTKTGWPVKTDVVAVTLVSDIGRSADIDALSTICLIKGSEEGLAFIEGVEGVEATFTLEDGSRLSTSGMQFKEQ